VEAQIMRLAAEFGAFKSSAHEEYLRRQEYQTTNATEKLRLAKELEEYRINSLKELSELKVKQASNFAELDARHKAADDKIALAMMALVESMRLGGTAGREAAETKGRIEEAISALKSEISDKTGDRYRGREGMALNNRITEIEKLIRENHTEAGNK
jgi:hypothetical protein